VPPIAARAWAGCAAAAHADYFAWQSPQPMPGAVDLWQVVARLRERLPENAILTNGAGNNTAWLHRLYRYAHYRSQLAPYSGAMGYGVPAAVAAKAVHPDRIVVSWNGDGCFLMNGQELATAVQYGLAVVFIVVDNAMYGTIRMHQERHYPARVYGTDLVNPDFAALARAYGAHGETVSRTEEFAPALERALAAGRPALLHLPIDPEAITMSATISALRARSTTAAP
jgi:acetolactate synthase-1/2/3 large subunit